MMMSTSASIDTSVGAYFLAHHVQVHHYSRFLNIFLFTIDGGENFSNTVTHMLHNKAAEQVLRVQLQIPNTVSLQKSIRYICFDEVSTC